MPRFCKKCEVFAMPAAVPCWANARFAGFADRNEMLKYMGFSPMMRWVVPQMVLIDRTGTIRYQTPPEGDPQLGLEGYLKGKIVELLNEKPGAAASAR